LKKISLLEKTAAKIKEDVKRLTLQFHLAEMELSNLEGDS